MSEYKRPLLPCGCDSTVDISADEFQTTTCHNCGRQLTEFEKWRLAEENEKRIRQAECPHVLTTLETEGASIVRHTCDACGADRPLPEAKPPRRMLKPRKAVLYGELRDLKVELAEARASIEASDRELQATREAYQRLWIETRPSPAPEYEWHARPGVVWRSLVDRFLGRHKVGGLTSTGDPAMIAKRDDHPREEPQP